MKVQIRADNRGSEKLNHRDTEARESKRLTTDSREFWNRAIAVILA